MGVRRQPASWQKGSLEKKKKKKTFQGEGVQSVRFFFFFMDFKLKFPCKKGAFDMERVLSLADPFQSQSQTLLGPLTWHPSLPLEESLALITALQIPVIFLSAFLGSCHLLPRNDPSTCPSSGSFFASWWFAWVYFLPLDCIHLGDRVRVRNHVCSLLMCNIALGSLFVPCMKTVWCQWERSDRPVPAHGHGRELSPLSLMVAKMMHCGDYFILLSGFCKG